VWRVTRRIANPLINVLICEIGEIGDLVPLLRVTREAAHGYTKRATPLRPQPNPKICEI